jgi:hypothetical protein
MRAAVTASLSVAIALLTSTPVRAGLQLEQVQWGDGANPENWDIVEPFTVGGQTYLFFLQSQTGDGEIHKVVNGNVGPLVQDFNWRAGWTIVESFTVAEETFLLLYKEISGDFSVHRVNPDGTLGAEEIRRTESSDWDVMAVYSSGTDTYLYRLAKSLKPRAEVWKIGWTGPGSTPTPAGMHYTEWNDEGGGKAIYLDRHDVRCDAGEALARFHLQRSGGGNYRYEYRCVPAKSTGAVTSNTGWNDDGRGNAVFLDRHDVVCDEGKALTRFKLVRNPVNPAQYHYDYACCKVNP